MYSKKTDPIIYFNGPYYHLINDSLTYIFNDYQVVEAYHYKRDSTLSQSIKGKYKKEEIENTNYLKAFIQSYNNDVITNNTHYKK
jgi:hypothetical protein